MRRLRIGIDGFNLALPSGGGVATYADTLGRVLAGAGHAVEGIFGLGVGDDPALREARFIEGLATPPLAAGQRRLWDKARLLLAAAPPFRPRRMAPIALSGRLGDRLPPFSRLSSSADLFAIAHRHFLLHGRFLPIAVDDPPEIMHWTYPLPLRMVGARNVYTLHDLVPLRMPWATRDNKRHYARLVWHCARTAAQICTVSEASRRDIVALLGVPQAQVTDTGQTSLRSVASPSPADAALLESAFGLRPQEYFLFVGTIEPKKNVGRLIEACLSLDIATPLVLAGGRGWQAEAALASLGSGPGRARIVQLGYVPQEMLTILLGSARALLFPSLMEGFGLPVLEAFRAGTPVLTSNLSSLAEVAGEAAILIDPHDVAAIAAGLRTLDGDAALRARLSRQGRIRAAHFSPEKYLSRLENMYAEILGRPEGGDAGKR